MNFRGAFLLVLLPLLAACAEYKVNVGGELTNYYALRPTVAGYADMTFTPLALPTKRQDFEIGKTDGVFDFGGGPSYFKAFALPESTTPYEVVIGSYSMMADCYPCKSAYFYQVLTLLDAAKKPIDIVPVRGPDYVPGWSTVSRVMSVVLPAHSDARYLVIHTTRDFIENGESHFAPGASTMIMISPGVFVPISTPGSDKKSPGSPVGHMSVEVKEIAR